MHLLKAQFPTKAGCFSWHHPLWYLLRETGEPPGIPPTSFLSWELTCFPLEAAHWSREAKWHQERQKKKRKLGYWGHFMVTSPSSICPCTNPMPSPENINKTEPSLLLKWPSPRTGWQGTVQAGLELFSQWSQRTALNFWPFSPSF